MLNAQQANLQTLTLEDEGRFIGSVDIPNGIYSKMRASPLVVVERNFEARVQQLLKEYVTDMAKEYSVVHDDQEIAFENYSMYLLESLFRIRKRLGDQCWLTLQKKMQSALHEQQQTGSTDAHLRWLTPLLTEYYDPMYQSQINNRKDKIIFRGDFNSCLQFLNTSAINCTKPQ